MIMVICRCWARELSMIQDRKSLMLRWRSFSGGCSDMVIRCFAQNGGQYNHYGWMLLGSPVIIQDARLEISDAPLTLISRIGQRSRRVPFYIVSRPITSLWINGTVQPFDCRKDQTKIVDTPSRLTLEELSFWLNVIPSLLKANIQFLGNIVCIEQHRGLSVSEPALFTSSGRWMT
jgi:hypothetical protein